MGDERHINEAMEARWRLGIAAGHNLGLWARLLLWLCPQLRREREFLIAEWGRTIKVAEDMQAHAERSHRLLRQRGVFG